MEMMNQNVMKMETNNRNTLRRETSKSSQQRYRNRKKKREKENKESINDLKETIDHWRDYGASIVSRVMISSTNTSLHRYQMIQIYMDLYSRGVRNESSLSKIQCHFLQVNFSKKCKVNDSVVAIGPEGVHAQWVRYSKLHPQMTCTLYSIESPTPLVNVIVLHFEMVLPLRHRSIMALYPHMANNSIFLDKTMGKSLVLDVVKTFHFDEMNKIVQMSVGYDMLQPWLDLVQDMEMAVEVIAGCKLKTCLIDMKCWDIDNAIDYESKLKRIESALNGRRGRPRIDSDYTYLAQRHPLHLQILENLTSQSESSSVQKTSPCNKSSLSYILL